MNKLLGYIWLIRPLNCLMMGFTVIVGATIVDIDTLTIFSKSLTYAFLTGFMLTAASMVLNDYRDIEIDALNEPNRPIPSGLIKPKEALIYAVLLTLIGFITAYLTNIYCFVIAIFAWIIFVTYTMFGKQTGLPGNFLVSICVTIPFIYGSIVTTNTIKLNVLIFAFIVFLSNTGREITKGIVDVKGDKTQQVRTLAVHYGEKKAAITAVIFFLIAVSLTPLPWILNLVSYLYIPLVGITDFGFLISSLSLLRNSSRENTKKVKNVILFFFLIGLLAFLVGAAYK